MLVLVPEEWVLDNNTLDTVVGVIVNTLLVNAIGERIASPFSWRTIPVPATMTYTGIIVEIVAKNIAHNQLVVTIHHRDDDNVIVSTMLQLGFEKVRFAKLLVNRNKKDSSGEDTCVRQETWYCGVKYSGLETAIVELSKMATQAIAHKPH